MKRRVQTLVAIMSAVTALLALGITASLFVASPVVRQMGAELVIWPLPFIFMALIGSLLIWRRGENSTGWILTAAGLLMSWNAVAFAYTAFAYATTPPNWAAATASWLAFWLWIPASLLMGLFFLVFPTGKAISRFWRPVVRGSMAVTIGTFPAAALTWSARGPGLLEAPTPAEVPGGDLLSILGNGGFGVVMFAALISTVWRYRGGGSVERHQLKWLMFAAALMVGAFATVGGVGVITDTDDPISNPIAGLATLIAAASVPVAAGIAILKYRLYDIDVVINKTFVYFALAAFITLIYVGVVVGVGSLVGAGDEPNLGLSLLATGLVAVAFQPVRERTQRIANRIVYGQRLSPYEAVTSFSHRMAESLSFEEILPWVGQAAANAVGGERAKVKLLFPQGGSEEIFWPPTGADHTQNSFDATVSVLHQGNQVGEIAVAKKKGEALSPQEHKLLGDLASQAGLAFSNLRLTEELKAKLIELQESRRRIVSAQDEERRRMERDIHDGAQQQLVSMSVKLGLAKQLLDKDPNRAQSMLEELRTEASEAVETLRDLARGLYPPVLEEQGLVAALKSHIDKMGLKATVEAAELNGTRLDRSVEAAVYFVVREALQNAFKHAAGSDIKIELHRNNGDLSFEVKDQGPGFDPTTAKLGSGLQNMRDRIEALDGIFEIRSTPGEGSAVLAWLPIHRRSE